MPPKRARAVHGQAQAPQAPSDRDIWKQWQIQFNHHGSDRTGKQLDKLLNGRWISLANKRGLAAQARLDLNAAPAAPVQPPQQDADDDVGGGQGVGQDGATDGTADEAPVKGKRAARERRAAKEKQNAASSKHAAEDGERSAQDVGSSSPGPVAGPKRGKHAAKGKDSDADTFTETDSSGRGKDTPVDAQSRASGTGQVGGGSGNAGPSDAGAGNAGNNGATTELEVIDTGPDDGSDTDVFLIDGPALTDDKEGRWLVGPFEHATISDGAQGQIAIYRKVNAKQELIDRVAIKDSLIEAPGAYNQWHGDPKDEITRKPIEVHIMETLTGRPGAGNIVSLRKAPPLKWDLGKKRYRYRIYMDYCAYGTLQTLIDPNGKWSHNKKVVPEPVIWSIFNDLVNACLCLQYGGIQPTDAVADWTPIIHRDMKLENVFIDKIDESRAEFPLYYNCRLGDFGLAIMIKPESRDNPVVYMDMGTPCWQAPEQETYQQDNVFDWDARLDEKTNVWGIGAIVARLMEQRFGPSSPDYSKKVKDQATIVLQRNLEEYSDELKALVAKCVSYQPEKRPGIRQLRNDLLSHTIASSQEDHADGLTTMTDRERLKGAYCDWVMEEVKITYG